MGDGVDEACSSSGCLGFFHDLLIRVVHKIRRHHELHPEQPVDNLPGFAAQVARSEITELQRAQRVSRGLPAKPTRNDGVAGRINSVLARDAHTGEWLVTLFRIMRAYPFSHHHVCGSWPIDGLAEERAKFLPGGDARQVRREIDLVLATATAEAGRTWVFNNLVMPLMSHGDHIELTPDQPDPKETNYDDAALATLLREAYWRYRGRGYSSRAALRVASQQVCGIRAPINAETDKILNELEAQPPANLVQGLAH